MLFFFQHLTKWNLEISMNFDLGHFLNVTGINTIYLILNYINLYREKIK